MRALKTNKILVSVYQSTNELSVNEANHDKAKEILRREGVSYRVLDAMWKGFKEKTILLESNSVKYHEDNLKIAINLANLYSQQCFLEVCNDDTAILHNVKGGYTTGKIGQFVEVEEVSALMKDAYTFDAVAKRYFIVK